MSLQHFDTCPEGKTCVANTTGCLPGKCYWKRPNQSGLIDGVQYDKDDPQTRLFIAANYWREKAVALSKGNVAANEMLNVQDNEIDALRTKLQAAESRALAAERDADRYRWLRMQHWNDAAMCVVAEPKLNVKLSAYCPSESLLDAAIDAARRK